VVNASAVLPLNSQTLLGFNQETYQHLQAALQSAPPHRLWIAVCDDLTLQRQVAAALDYTLLDPALAAAMPDTERPTSWYFIEDDSADWVATLMARPFSAGGLTYQQILGVEQLTYQSSDQQYQFLASLRQLAAHGPNWACSLLLWLPHPWLQQVRRSAPELYHRCDRVFKFLGDPRPLPAISPGASATQPVDPGPWVSIRPPQPARPERLEPDPLALIQVDSPVDRPTDRDVADKDRPTLVDLADEPPPLPTELAALGETPAPPWMPLQAQSLSPDIWHRLSSDLSQLEQSPITPQPFLPSQPTAAERAEYEAVNPEHPAPIPIPPAPPPAAPANVGMQSANALKSLPWLEAHRLRDQVEAGDHSISLLKAAIAQYENVLEANITATAQRAEGLNDLGSLYWMWAQQVTDIETRRHYLQHSIQQYESALTLAGADSNTDPLATDTLMRIHSNLGSVYCLQAAHDHPEHHLTLAVRAFHQALQYVDAEQDGALYVTVQTHLGTAYWSLAQHSQTPDYLHQAIAAYGEALQRCSAQMTPNSYGQLHNNLGIAYWSLAQHERPLMLLEAAIAAYRQALAHRTRQVDPVGYGATQNNLGTAYWDLGRQYPSGSSQQQQAWLQAIAAYEAALGLSPEQSAQGFDRWATHHSLGVVYEQLAMQAPVGKGAPIRSADPFQRAIDHYVQAMTGWQGEQATLAETAFQSILNNLRQQAQSLGIEAQQNSLAHIPAALLPEVWRQL
jgi:tetratricopeptide (TPR) repeat protein